MVTTVIASRLPDAAGALRVLTPNAAVIMLREICVASRFGGYCYGGRSGGHSWTEMAITLGKKQMAPRKRSQRADAGASQGAPSPSDQKTLPES